MSARQIIDVTESRWRALGAVDPDALVHSRLTLHHAVQLLSAFGQAMVPPLEDDSHRSATWYRKRRSFRGRETPGGLIASLVVPSLELEVWREEDLVGSLELRGRRPSQSLAWLGNLLADAGGSSGPLAWPEYDLPEQPGGVDAPLDPRLPSLEEFAVWYGNAAYVLGTLFGGLPESSAIRCWPHHFDLATLLTYADGRAAGDAAYVGIGFSPGDEAIPLPYYYVNGWPPPSPDSLPALAGPGAWHSEGWVGAVLGAEEIVLSGVASKQERTVTTFLTNAVDAMRSTVLTAR